MRVGVHTGLTSLDKLVETCREMDVSDVFLGLGAFPEFERRDYAAVRIAA